MVEARKNRDTKRPKIKVTMPQETLVACRLAREGYYSSPGAVLAAPVDEVLDTEEHSNFVASYSETMQCINQEEKL